MGVYRGARARDGNRGGKEADESERRSYVEDREPGRAGCETPHIRAGRAREKRRAKDLCALARARLGCGTSWRLRVWSHTKSVVASLLRFCFCFVVVIVIVVASVFCSPTSLSFFLSFSPFFSSLILPNGRSFIFLRRITRSRPRGSRFRQFSVRGSPIIH